MPDTNIASATSSNLTDTISDITVSPQITDAATGQEETFYINTKWAQQLAYYKEIPECKQATDTLVRWTLGGGWEADPETTVILDNISGTGHDTFTDILENMDRVASIGGDSFAERIGANGLLNLKPLDPSTIKQVVNSKGIILRYEQMSKTSNLAIQTFKPNQIFHLSNKRIADEIHGISDYEALEPIILANKESFVIQKKVIKHFAKPMLHFQIDSDNQTKINDFVANTDAITDKGENLYTPFDTVKKVDVIAIPPNATLNMLPWREHLRNYFFQVCGIPQILMGSSGEFTESTAKIAYLAFEQTVKQRQRYIESQVWNQLALKIKLTFPSSLQNELISDTSKDGQNQQTGFQPSDVAIGAGAG